MEQVLSDEKQRIKQELQSSINNLQKLFEGLKIEIENEIKEKDQIIHQMQQKIEKLQEKPKINDVKKDATELGALLEIEQAIFYQKYNKIQEKVKSSDQLVTQISNLRTYYE